jgi:hypothetical protein
MVFVGNTQNAKKVLTFRKTRFIIADINDEGVRNENLFLALFLLQGNTS